MGSQRVNVPGIRVLRQKREMGRRERLLRVTIIGGRGEFDQRCGEKRWGVAGGVGLTKKNQIEARLGECGSQTGSGVR